MKKLKFLCAIMSLVILLPILFTSCEMLGTNSEKETSAEPQTIELATPFVTISDTGLAEWDAIEGTLGYTYKINSGAEKNTKSTSVQLNEGDTIQVKAVGDGKNFVDSPYSTPQTYKTENTTSEETTSEETETQEITYDGSEVEITFYHTMGANLRSVLDKYIAEFNKMYPNIKITHSQEGGYDDVRDKIVKELTVGNQPNIAYCYPDHVALYNLAGSVATLDKFIDSNTEITDALGRRTVLGLTTAQKADFIDAFYSEGAQFGDGKMYTLPMSKSTEVLYYNKTFFEEHNLKVPTTWDEMEEICKKIKEIDPNCIPLGYDSEANWFITMCQQYNSPYTSATGNHFLFDNEVNRTFVKRFSEWHAKGYVTTQEIYGSYTSGLFVEQNAGATRSYMSIGSSAGSTHYSSNSFEVGIVSIPQIIPESPKVICQGPSLCMFNGHGDQETAATWLFMKFLTTNVDFQAEFSMVSGYTPVIKSVENNWTYKSFLTNANGDNKIRALSAKVCLEQKDAYYVSPAFNGSSEARDQVGALLQKCMTQYKAAPDKDKMIKEAFEVAIEECEYMS